MKIKLTLQRSGRPAVDLFATVDAATRVSEFAAHLAQADPGVPKGASAPSGVTIGVVGPGQRVIDPRLSVGDSGLRSGAVIALTRSGVRYGAGDGEPAAVLTAIGGPDKGREFKLSTGTTVIGREHGCEVALTDPMVSRYHAQVKVSDLVEIIDLGSANGVQLGDASVARAVLRAGDVVQIGDTVLSVWIAPPARAGVDGVTLDFVRSPRLDPRYEGVELSAPEPPQPREATRFPLIPLLAPVLMGGLLYLITRSVTSLAFVALSPIMLIGHAVESAIAGRSADKRAVRQFRDDLAELIETATANARTETAARGAEHPPLAECTQAVRLHTPLLWTRRPADPGFCELRLGTGRQPARNTITVPDGRRARRDLHTELLDAVRPFETIDGVPVLASPADHGAVGLAGPRPGLLACARAVVVQFAALHSPAELVIAGFASAQTCLDWDWLKWLPHTTSAHSPVPARLLASNGTEAANLISELESLLARRDAGDAGPTPSVIVLIENDAPVDRSRLVELAEHGRAAAVHVLWLAGDTAALPAACRTFVSLDGNNPSGTAGFVHTGQEVAPLVLDTLDHATAHELARQLAPLVDSGARVDDDSDLPRSVSLLRIPEPALRATPEVVIERWLENRSIVTGPFAPAEPIRQAGTLRAVIGKSALGAHAIDLRADGPHALVGGTTGSGKSELLQAWILAMAVAHSPQRLNFLLVDYKGGSALGDLGALPHTVGLFTDLSPHLVRRALTSLSAELQRREKLFAEHKVKDLVELERRGSVAAPPSLVIVVDEFAALVTELPEFVDGVVNVAQRGRSLGVHLILATQRPAGVIRDNLRANTNLRLALRTADENDSVDVLGSPQAAFFDPALPGRAVSKTGPGRMVAFQTGYAGGWTSQAEPKPEIAVEELRFGTGPTWTVRSEQDTETDPGPTDIQLMIRAIGAACRHAQIPPSRRPWLPELRTAYDQTDYDQIPTERRDDQLVYAILDNPREQSQPTVAFHPDEGNLVVYGTGGSGKSTLLRAIAIAAGFTVRGGPCHVYGLDFSSRGLAMLADLPHVGSIVEGSDTERVARLVSWLRTLIEQRAQRYQKAGAGSITEYRSRAGAPDEPRILLLLDGAAAFRQAYEVGDRSKVLERFIAIATEGRPVGVHVLVAADRPAAVPSALASALQTRVVLRMAEAEDYAMMGLPVDVLTPLSPPGRGLLGISEIQVALLGPSPDLVSQAVYARGFADARRRAGASEAPAVRRLTDRVTLGELPVEIGGAPVVGLSYDTLGPMTFAPRGSFLIAGPPGSGRSTALHTLALALRRHDPSIRLHYFGIRRSAFDHVPGLWDTQVFGVGEAVERVPALTAELTGGGAVRVAVFVEAIGEFANGMADLPMTELAKAVLAQGGMFVGEGETSTLTSGSLGVIAQSKVDRTGIVLAPDPNDGTMLLRTPFPPRLNRADFPPGRGLFVRAGKATVVQLAQADTGSTGRAKDTSGGVPSVDRDPFSRKNNEQEMP